jgi:hypothetical protein
MRTVRWLSSTHVPSLARERRRATDAVSGDVRPVDLGERRQDQRQLSHGLAQRLRIGVADANGTSTCDAGCGEKSRSPSSSSALACPAAADPLARQRLDRRSCRPRRCRNHSSRRSAA